MAVRIRMKRMGRRHRPFYRVCAVDARAPRDGRVIEELGYYDPMVKETDARVRLNRERVDHWLSVGAQPSDKVAVLIKKYGTNGTHVAAQEAAFERLQASKPTAPPPVAIPKAEAPAPVDETAAEAPETEAAAEEGAAEEGTADTAEPGAEANGGDGGE
ncbi:MAG: 30S ribosomal protein S16 [Planctomycetales bacterium]|nr:30S ribosomal protein S16 [Planctomycetales bacterium]